MLASSALRRRRVCPACPRFRVMWPCRGCRALATDDAFRDVLIAVDTFHSEVARSAIAAGAHMVNDVSGGEFDEDMHAEVRSSLPSQR